MPDEPDLDPDAAAARETARLEQQRRNRSEAHKLTREERRHRDQQAVDLRLAGYPYDVIARRLGYGTASGAWRAVDAVRKRTIRESGAALIALDLDRFDRLTRAAMTNAIKGDAKSIAVVLRIMDQRAKLLGLADARDETRIADARDAFAAFLGAAQARFPDPETDQEPAA